MKGRHPRVGDEASAVSTDRLDRKTRLTGRMLVLAARLLSYVPLTWSQSLGVGLGWLADHVDSRPRRRAEANLAACFPQLSPGDQRSLRRRVMLHLARFMSELPAVWFRSGCYWARRLDTSAFDSRGGRLLARGRGLIIALPHLGNWELGVHGFGSAGEITVLYRPARDPALELLLRRGRERNEVRMVRPDTGGLRAICTTLKDGKAVVILPDQSPGDDQAGAVYGPFFGVPAWTMTLLSRLARQTGAPVVFCWFERRSAGRFTLRCFEANPAIASRDSLEAVRVLNAGVERCVKCCPDQYLWTYRRFKPAPPGEASIYGKSRKNRPSERRSA